MRTAEPAVRTNGLLQAAFSALSNNRHIILLVAINNTG